MNAVRSEVEELKEKIVKLEETISQQQIELNKTQTDFAREVGRLQAENDFLRGHAELIIWYPQTTEMKHTAVEKGSTCLYLSKSIMFSFKSHMA